MVGVLEAKGSIETTCVRPALPFRAPPPQATIDNFYSDHAAMFNALRGATWALTALPAVANDSAAFAVNVFDTAAQSVTVVVLATGGGGGGGGVGGAAVTVTVNHLPSCAAPHSVVVQQLSPGEAWQPLARFVAPVASVSLTPLLPRASTLLQLTCAA
jgi:hypothetical protein